MSTNWKECGKQSCNLRYYCSTCLGDLRKTVWKLQQASWSPSQYWRLVHTEPKARTLPAHHRHLLSLNLAHSKWHYLTRSCKFSHCMSIILEFNKKVYHHHHHQDHNHHHHQGHYKCLRHIQTQEMSHTASISILSTLQKDRISLRNTVLQSHNWQSKWSDIKVTSVYPVLRKCQNIIQVTFTS